MNDCKQCKHHGISIWGDIGCFLLCDWLTKEEYKQKKTLDKCPLKEQK